MADERETNGNVRWRDVAALESRLRNERTEQYQRFEDSVRTRLDRAHIYHTDLAEDQSKAIVEIAKRIDAVESVLDQQRGARNLVYMLIGSNMLLVAVSLFTIMHLFGII